MKEEWVELKLDSKRKVVGTPAFSYHQYHQKMQNFCKSAVRTGTAW